MKRLIAVFALLLVSLSVSANAEQIKFAFVGDILLARSVGREIIANGVNYPFAKVVPILKNADIAFGNFECTLYGRQITGSNTVLVFRAPGEFAKAVFGSGIDVVGLANNHMLDSGRAGVTSTIQNLHACGIRTVGAGNTAQTYQCQILSAKGVKVGFLAFTDIANTGLRNAAAGLNTPGVATTLDINKLKAAIAVAKSRCSIMVVSFHFGNEYQTQPSKRQQYLATVALSSGADIIIGHHPHVLQPVVQIKGKTVAWSLGNFVFDNHRPSRARTEILEIVYDTKTGKQSFKTIPCYIRHCQPQVL